MRRLLPLVLVLAPSLALAGFRVSSFKKESRGPENIWNAASALDNDRETAWMVDPEQPNEGSWFEIDIPKSTLDKLSVVSGWDKDETTFLDYPRPKAIKIEVFDEGKGDEKVLEHVVTLEDTRDWQTVDLPDTEVGNEVFGGKVRMTITEVYPGKDYPNLAMSEVLLHLAEYEAPAKVTEPPASAAEGHAPEAMVDGSARTFWASEGAGTGQTFTVEADGFGVSRIGIRPGPRGFARPKTIQIDANQVTRKYTVENTDALQWFEVPAIVGYTGSGWGEVTVTVLDTHDDPPQPAVAISEIQLKATNYGGL